MAYWMEFANRPDHLYIRLSGERNRQNGRQIIDGVAQEVSGRKQDRVLLDFRTKDSDTSIVDDYDSASYAADQLAQHCSSIACLLSKEAYHRSVFMEVVDVDGGLRMRYFHEEEKAICWLEREHSTEPHRQMLDGLDGSPIEVVQPDFRPRFREVG
jgi:hypothetical protein